jgi:hypothetical protein
LRLLLFNTVNCSVFGSKRNVVFGAEIGQPVNIHSAMSSLFTAFPVSRQPALVRDGHDPDLVVC